MTTERLILGPYIIFNVLRDVNLMLSSCDFFLDGELETQGGGHGFIHRCFIGATSTPAIAKPLNVCEAATYQKMQSTPMSSVIPEFFGVCDDFLVISDLTAGFMSPCVADFKVGSRHYDPGAPVDKVRRLIARQDGTTTNSVCLRIVSAQVMARGSVCRVWTRSDGLSFSVMQMETAINEFIPGALRKQFADRVAGLSRAFREMVDEFPSFRMYSASVLLVYDGDDPTELRAVFIDFAHTHMSLTEEGYDVSDRDLDDNVANGLCELQRIAGVCEFPGTDC